MVTMKEIRKNDRKAECVAFVEDSHEGVAVSYDFESSRLSDYALPLGYEWCTSHMGHVRRYLASLKDAETVPTQKRIAWY